MLRKLLLNKKLKLLLILILFCFVIIIYYGEKCAKLKSYNQAVLLTDNSYQKIGIISKLNGDIGYWKIDKMPIKLQKTILAAEDKRYFSHFGVDFIALIRAIYQDIINFHIVSGASTIPMQIIRIQENHKRTIFNKLIEMYAAISISLKYDKKKLLKHYAVITPLGNRYRGFAFASRMYFDKPLIDLSFSECAILTAILKYPAKANLYKKKGRLIAISRAKNIINRLLKNKKITNNQYSEANFELNDYKTKSFIKFKTSPKMIHIINRLKTKNKKIKLKQLTKTTINLQLQNHIYKLSENYINSLHKSGAGNVGVIVAEKNTGNIISYIGSVDYFDTIYKGSIDYNNIYRSSGSILKPFIYALALDKSIVTPATILPDINLFFNKTKSIYIPANYDKKYIGPILLRYALANSRNVPAIYLTNKIGVPELLNFLELLGIKPTPKIPKYTYGLSIAVGGLYVKLFDVVKAYGVLANDGNEFKLKFIAHSKKTDFVKSFIDKNISRQITLFLSDPEARTPSFPRMGDLEYKFPVAIKTGTSYAYRDAWCVAYSKKYIIGVWTGDPDNENMNELNGSNSSAKLLKKIMNYLYKNNLNSLKYDAFPLPENYKSVKICCLSGKPVNDLCDKWSYEYFPKNYKFATKCNVHRFAYIDKRTNEIASENCDSKYKIKKIITVLPEQYTEWAIKSGFKIYNTKLKSRDFLFHEKQYIKILYPISGSVFYLLPDIDENYQTISLKAKIIPEIMQAVWYVDGLPYRTVKFPYNTRLKLSIGKHILQIKSPFSDLKSDKIFFYVK